LARVDAACGGHPVRPSAPGGDHTLVRLEHALLGVQRGRGRDAGGQLPSFFLRSPHRVDVRLAASLVFAGAWGSESTACEAAVTSKCR
jgi:hypothetical protein